jgi:hypothetical protein
LAMGCADSFTGDGDWSESCGDVCGRCSSQETAPESHANSANGLSTMPNAGQPIRRRLSELPHPPLPPAQILSAPSLTFRKDAVPNVFLLRQLEYLHSCSYEDD